jgi:hypothetical protein
LDGRLGDKTVSGRKRNGGFQAEIEQSGRSITFYCQTKIDDLHQTALAISSR